MSLEASELRKAVSAALAGQGVYVPDAGEVAATAVWELARQLDETPGKKTLGVEELTQLAVDLREPW